MPLEPRRQPPPPDAAQALSVAELTSALKELIETGFPGVWVKGELSNVRHQSSGHCYFTLKDAAAQISAVMFRGDLLRSGAELRDGQQVLLFGNLTVYEVRGSYQIVVRQVVDAGVGKLQAEFERLKRRLAAEGLFESSRKRSLPALPVRVGFITSPTGAAVQDFCRILLRRDWRGRVVVIPARVQGAEAAGELRAALATAQALEEDLAGEPVLSGGVRPWFDLLVIGRGGGSLEDLWCFNDEALVRAVAACRIPIISAVGHEIDFTLCDFAADVRAETPSAAAELLSNGFVEARETAARLGKALESAVARQASDARRTVEAVGGRLSRQSPDARLERMAQRVDDLASRLDSAAQARLLRLHQRSAFLSQRLASAHPALRVSAARNALATLDARFHRLSPERRLAPLAERLRGLGARLESLGPGSVLKRGFAIVRDAEGRPVSQAATASAAASLEVEFSDGRIEVNVGPKRRKPRTTRSE